MHRLSGSCEDRMNLQWVVAVVASVACVSSWGEGRAVPFGTATVAAKAPTAAAIAAPAAANSGEAAAGPLDREAAVARVVNMPPPVAPSSDDDESAPLDTSTYAWVLAFVGVLLFIARRLRRD
jgi:hypothetical protein